MSSTPTPVEVFYSYAHEDKVLRQRLETHLNMLNRQGLISSWHDRQILAGTDRAKAIDPHIETASVILLLISADFIASDYCYGTEMKRALERHKANQARVIPIILRPVDWKGMPFAHLQALPTNAMPITSWNNQDEAFINVIQGIQRVLDDLSSYRHSTLHTPRPAIWNVPYRRNPFFTGRDNLLLQLRSQLQAGQVTAISQPLAISGLGGIGKTQLAIEYAYRYRQEYEAVFWAHAEAQETLISSYNTIATLLKLPEREAQEQEITIAAVKQWLQTHQKWLLILDNADDLTLLPPFLPLLPAGHLLLTTRAQALGRLAHRIQVETLPDEQGALFLLRRAMLIAPDESLEQVSSQERQLALQITEELGGLPLALDQAGAYLEETATSLAKYLATFQQRRATLLKERGGLVSDHPEPVATTWSLSFERIEQWSPAAADLLRLCAFLHPDAIPEEIVIKGAMHLGPLLESIAEDPSLLSEAIAALRSYSLIRRNPSNKTLSIHRLVQAVFKDAMDEATRVDWERRTIQAVNAAFPEVAFTNWVQCERCLPHALTCATMIEQNNFVSLDAASLLYRVGWYLDSRAQYREAEPLYRRALAIREQQLGPQHPHTANILNNLAELYRAQGKYGQAEPLYMRALAIYEQQLGSQHPDTAIGLNNLAALYRTQGMYEQAEPLYVRALAIYEQQLGSQHPDTATSLNNLAALYRAQGKYELAKPLLQRALTIREQQLGPQHPDTATSLSNLAECYQDQGNYEQAEPLLQRALAIDEKTLGSQHPTVATDLNNLAELYRAQGKYEQAEPLLQHALAIYEQQLGSQHPNTANILNNLAMLYYAGGKYEQAEPLLQHALTIYEQQLGPHHPDTLAIRKNYRSLL